MREIKQTREINQRGVIASSKEHYLSIVRAAETCLPCSLFAATSLKKEKKEGKKKRRKKNAFTGKQIYKNKEFISVNKKKTHC